MNDRKIANVATVRQHNVPVDLADRRRGVYGILREYIEDAYNPG